HLQPERGLVQPGRTQPLERPHRRLENPPGSTGQMPELVGHSAHLPAHGRARRQTEAAATREQDQSGCHDGLGARNMSGNRNFATSAPPAPFPWPEPVCITASGLVHSSGLPAAKPPCTRYESRPSCHLPCSPC